MPGPHDDEREKPLEIHSEEVQVESPEVQAAKKALEDPNVPSSIADAGKKLLQARKDAEQAEEGDPKEKAKKAFEKAKDDFLKEFSTVDENGNPKIPKDEGEALAEILAKALMALMTPLRMGAAASGLTYEKDKALDSMGEWAKEQANDLVSKMKDAYNKKEPILSVSGGPQNEQRPAPSTPEPQKGAGDPEVGGVAPTPKPDLAEDLSKQSQVVEHAAKGFMDVAKQVADKGGDAADYVIKGLGAMKNALGLAGASAKAQADPTTGLSDVSGNPDSVKIEPLLSQSPRLTLASDKQAEEVNATPFKSKPAPTQPTPENTENTEKDDKKRLT